MNIVGCSQSSSLSSSHQNVYNLRTLQFSTVNSTPKRMNSDTVEEVMQDDLPFIGGKTIMVRKNVLIALVVFIFAFKYGVPNLHYMFMYIQQVVKSLVKLFKKRKSRESDETLPSEETRMTATVSLTNIGMYVCHIFYQILTSPFFKNTTAHFTSHFKKKYDTYTRLVDAYEQCNLFTLCRNG